MGEQCGQLNRSTGKGEEEEGVMLCEALAVGFLLCLPSASSHQSDHAQIPMQGFGRMQKRGADGKAVHRRHHLIANLAALAHTADDQLPTPMDRLGNRIDGLHETFLGDRIRLVQLAQMGQSIALRGDDMQRRAEGSGVAGGVQDFVRVGRGHGQRRNGLANMGERGGHEGGHGRQRLILRSKGRHGRALLFHRRGSGGDSQLGRMTTTKKKKEKTKKEKTKRERSVGIYRSDVVRTQIQNASCEAVRWEGEPAACRAD